MVGSGGHGSAGATFRKVRPVTPGTGFFAAEAAGLAWLTVPGGPPLPNVHAVGANSIDLDRIPLGRAQPAAARQFGERLALLHDCGAPHYGSSPPGAPEHGWIGDLPMGYAERDDFATFWALDRIAPTARAARDRGGLDHAQLQVIDRLCEALLGGQVDTGGPEPACRLHGDLWSGNVVWDERGQGWLVDPAAHGGHRESDLAMLDLFGAPFLAEIDAGYQSIHPLAAGWAGRVGLHQLWPLLVHAALFGGGYGASAAQAAQHYL